MRTITHLDGELALIAWQVRSLERRLEIRDTRKTRARLRRLDRVLGQWTDQEIAAMSHADASAIAALRRMRRELAESVNHGRG
jgi:small-conductance mechanosensitive channel